MALEAARWEYRLVVGDTGGLAEFVTDQRGRRCRLNDAADLAAQIVTSPSTSGANSIVAARTPACTESVHLGRSGSPHGGGVRQGATAPASGPGHQSASKPDLGVKKTDFGARG